MRGEALVFQRCCMCIPLRYGLIAWGYLRLLLAGFVLCMMSLEMDRYVQNVKRTDRIYDIVTSSLFIIVVIADIILGIVFIIGCHTKNPVLIKRYYYHNLFLLGLIIAVSLFSFSHSMYLVIKYGLPFAYLWLYVISVFVGTFAYVCVQVYVTLLIRSQFIKLNVACEFRFENKLTEAECSVNMEGSNEEKMAEISNPIDNNNDGGEIRNYVY